MNIIRSKTAFYPSFEIGCEPRVNECEIHLVEANGKRYVRTPFAMLDAFAEDEIERQIDGRRFYETAKDAERYLAFEYPWHKQAAPINEYVLRIIQIAGKGEAVDRACQKFGLSACNLHLFARGHRSVNLKAIRSAIKSVAVAG